MKNQILDHQCFLGFEQIIEKCIVKFSRNHYRKKSNLKNRKLIQKREKVTLNTENHYKMFKQFDLRYEKKPFHCLKSVFHHIKN